MKHQFTSAILFSGICMTTHLGAANAQPTGSAATTPNANFAAPISGDNSSANDMKAHPTAPNTNQPPNTNPTFPSPSQNPTPNTPPPSVPLDGISANPNGTNSATAKTQAPSQGAMAQPSRADRRLSRKAREALTHVFPVTPGVNGAPSTGGIGGLKVTSLNGTVTLSGTVSTQQQKDEAAAKVAALAGGEANVVNQLIVK